MKKIFLVLLAVLPFFALSAKTPDDVHKYLVGAVPMKNGIVVFEKTYEVPNKSAAQIFLSLKSYLNGEIHQENSLEQSRIVESDSLNGIIGAQMEEWLYFKRKAWVTDRARFFYKLYFRVSDGKFSIEMHHLNYRYNEEDQSVLGDAFTAEDWITDKDALTRDGKSLTRKGGKFRRFTIDRKNELFKGAAKSTDATIKTKKVTTIVEE